jgi:hypothetical protein
MNSEQITEIAVKIARIVAEKGRITASPDDREAWLIELEREVEFEAREQGYDNSAEIAKAAVAVYH